MSDTFSNFMGCNWGKRYIDLVPPRHCAAGLVLKTVAEMFDKTGRCAPYIAQIIQDMNGKRSRGQIMRELNFLERIGFWTITNRGGGRSRPLTITARGWNEPLVINPAESVSRPAKRSRPESVSPKPPESVCPQRDSSSTDTDSKASPVHTSQTSKQEHPSGGGTADAAPPPPSASAGPAGLVIEKNPQAKAVEIWNQVARQSRLIEAGKPPYGLVAKAIKLPGIDGDLTKWQAYCLWLSMDGFYGGHDTGRAADLIQACQSRPIDIWRKASKPTPRPPEDELQPLDADCDRPHRRASAMPEGFDPDTDPLCAMVHEVSRSGRLAEAR